MPQSLYITYAFPLDRSRRELAEKRGLPYPTMEEVRATASEWKTIWETTNADDRIATHLSHLTGVTLPYPVEACIIGGLLTPMSFPLILPITDQKHTKYTSHEFLNHCIHEFCHRFLSTKENAPWIRTYWDESHQRNASEPIDTRNHILLYALLQLTLPTLVSEECWLACQKISHPDYQRAFDLMQKRGAQECLDEFRSYASK